MPERKTVTIPLGPLYMRGDLVKAPEGTSSKIRNCAFRRGVVEKRWGFYRESGTGVPTNPGSLYEFSTDSATYLVAATALAEEAADAEYRNNDGTWTALTGVNAYWGAAEYEAKLYMLGADEALGRDGVIDSFDGTTVVQAATKTRVGGRAIAQFGGRLLVGSAKFQADNGGSSDLAFDNAGAWTVGGAWAQPTGATVRTATIVNGATDTITMVASFYTTGSEAEYVTAVFEIQAVSATATTPIKVSIQDAAGTTTYGLAQYVVPNATDDAEWRQYFVTVLCPASTDLYAKLAIGNDTGNGTAGVTLRLSDGNTTRGFAGYPGRLVYPYSSGSLSGQEYRSRVYFSEPLDFTDWRNENFFEVDEAPGYVTAIGVVNDRVVVFKNRGMWIYRAGPSALAPFLREAYIPGVGCVDRRAVTVFGGVMYFIAENEVYAFDGASAPVALCGDAVKDDMFPEKAISGVICVDTDNREVWVRPQVTARYPYEDARKIYLYSIDAGQWIGYYQITDSTASEAPFAPYGVIGGMLYTMPQGEDRHEMYLTFGTSATASTLCRLFVDYGLDNVDGTARDVVAEYVLHPLETPRPRQQMTVQEVGIDHKITGPQTDSTTRYSFSTDGGDTWSKYNDVRIPVATGAATDTDPIRVPLHQTAPRVVVKITHTGASSPDYFNMTGAEASIILRGREIQASNPTAVGSSL